MRFVSRVKNLRLVLKPADRIIDDNRRTIFLRGVTIEFGGGMYATDDKEVISTLLSHPLYGTEFTCADNEKRWKEDNKGVGIITGKSTTTSISTIGNTESVSSEEPKQVVDIDELIAEKVSVEMSKHFNEIKELISTAISKTEPVVDKKVFHCPICQEPFSNGFEVGKHKRENHPEIPQPPSNPV